MRYLAFLLLGLMSLPALAGPLTPFLATYHVDIDEKISATATREVTTTPDGNLVFKFSAQSMLAGLSEQAEVSPRKDAVYPLRYESERRVLFKTTRALLTFNWPKKVVVIEGGKYGGVREESLDKGGLDPLSLELQIRQDLSTGKIRDEYVLADDRGVRAYRFHVIGEETIEVPAGKFTALKAARVADDPERQTMFWFAKSLDYLPVRILQIDNGAKYSFELQSYTPSTTSTPPSNRL